MSVWLNNKKQIWKEIIKPCRMCGFCPYGQLVEEFPIREERSKESCSVFGHDCPVYYHGEPFAEEQILITGKEISECNKEFKKFFNVKKKKNGKICNK